VNVFLQQFKKVSRFGSASTKLTRACTRSATLSWKAIPDTSPWGQRYATSRARTAPLALRISRRTMSLMIRRKAFQTRLRNWYRSCRPACVTICSPIPPSNRYFENSLRQCNCWCHNLPNLDLVQATEVSFSCVGYRNSLIMLCSVEILGLHDAGILVVDIGVQLLTLEVRSLSWSAVVRYYDRSFICLKRVDSSRGQHHILWQFSSTILLIFLPFFLNMGGTCWETTLPIQRCSAALPSSWAELLL